MLSESFAPLVCDNAMYEVGCHGYHAPRCSKMAVSEATPVYFVSVHDEQGYYLSSAPVVAADSRHDLNLALPASAKTPQTEIRWTPARLRDNVSCRGSFIELFCAPLRVDCRPPPSDYEDDDDSAVMDGFVHDPNVFIRYFTGNYAVYFSTCTPVGPRFWSRLFARSARAPECFSAAVPLYVRHLVTTYQFLIQSLAAMVLQNFVTRLPFRIMYRRAQRRRLLKLALLRSSSSSVNNNNVLRDESEQLLLLAWRLKATPESIWNKVLAYL